MITLFGVVWIILGVYLIIKKKETELIEYTLVGMTLQSNNVLILGGVGIGPQVISSLILIIGSIYFNNYILPRLKNTGFVNILIFIMFVSVSLFVNNDLSGKANNIIQLLIYLVCFYHISILAKKETTEQINKIIIRVIIFVVTIGILQYLSIFNVIPKALLQPLFFNDTGNSVAFNSGENALRLYSTFMEPSYCAAFLVGSLYYLLSNIKQERNKRKTIFLLAIIGLEILLTMSTTAYVATVVVGVFYIFIGNNKKTFFKFIPVGMVVLLFMMAFFYDALEVVIFKKLEGGSASVRSFWNENTWEAFLNHKLWGVGFKNSRASSLWYCLLGENGLFGAISYWFANMFYLRKLFVYRKSMNCYRVGGLFFLLTVLVCQLIACPDIDFCVYWMALYIIGILSYSRSFSESSY